MGLKQQLKLKPPPNKAMFEAIFQGETKYLTDRLAIKHNLEPLYLLKAFEVY
jgi:hypothetical protein